MIFKGKSIEEAINNGLKSLNITKDYAIITELEPIKIFFTQIYRVDISVNIEKIKYEKLEMQLKQEMEKKLKEEENKRKEIEAQEEEKRKKELEIQKGPNFDECVSEFLNFLEKTKKASKNTLESYERDIRQFKEYLLEKGYKFNKLNANDIEIYLEYLKSIGKKDATRARTVASLKKLYEFLISRGIVTDDSIINMKSVKVEKKEIDEQEVAAGIKKRQAMLHYNFEDTPKGYRDKAMLEITYKIKIKPTELISLTIDDFNTSSKTLKIGNRVEKLDDSAFEALMDYLKKSRNYLDIMQTERILFLNVNGKPMTRQGYWKIIKLYKNNIDMQEQVDLFIIDEDSIINEVRAKDNSTFLEFEEEIETVIEEEIEEVIEEEPEKLLKYEESLLHISVAKGNLSDVKEQIDNGSDVNLKTTSLITPIMQAIFAIILIKDNSENNKKIRKELGIQKEKLQDYENIIKLLVDNGADLEIKIPERNITIKEMLEKLL